MNSLSWMIYAADAASGITNFCLTVAVFSIVGIIIAALVVTFSTIDGEGIAAKPAAKLLKTLVPLAVVASLVSALLPSASTVYAIAASETGEEVLNSDTASKAMQALDAWLDRQIEGTDQ
jgi:hypothetical protein